MTLAEQVDNSETRRKPVAAAPLIAGDNGRAVKESLMAQSTGKDKSALWNCGHRGKWKRVTCVPPSYGIGEENRTGGESETDGSANGAMKGC